MKYSRYVSLMKVILPVGILLSIGLAVGWPYLTALNKQSFAFVDPSQPEILEKHMISPHYVSTDEKEQPFHMVAQRAKNLTDNLADLVNPKGAITTIEGETFNLEAQKGLYDTQAKVLNLEGNVTVTSTDGYLIKTEKAHVTLDNNTIEGNSYIEGEGPAGTMRGKNGFKVENRHNGKKVLTLKGPSRVVIYKAFTKKPKGSHAH
jgi:lipopolysaccharide export system protein LptC